MSGASDNVTLQMTELIVQNMHHPGICFWGLSNEISMFGVSKDLIRDHVALNALCHQTDPTRMTAIACWSMLPWDSPLLSIPDLISYNLYYGWYEGDVEDIGRWLDDFHRAHPDICLGISEYGAEGLIKWHSSDPAKGDCSEEYQAYYHRKAIEIIQERPYI